MKFITKLYNQYQAILKFNKFIKNKINKNNSSSYILVEYNSYNVVHVLYFFLILSLKKKFNSNLIVINNQILFNQYIDDYTSFLKWKLGSIFKIKYFSIYKSMGATNFIRPNTDEKIKRKSLEVYNNLIKKKFLKDELRYFKIENILVGDLIIDGFYKFYQAEELNIGTEKFNKYLIKFIELFYFWFFYSKKTSIDAIIGVQAYYSCGIIYRILLEKNIQAFLISNGRINRITKKQIYPNAAYLNYKEIFSRLSNDLKSKAINLSKRYIDNRLSGQTGKNINEIASIASSFSKINSDNKKILGVKKELKVLISTHSLLDAHYCFGDNFFPDFQTWLEEICNLSKETDYQWYIKDHPIQNKMKRSLANEKTSAFTKKLCKKYNNIVYIEPNTSHHQLIKEGIDVVLTVYGTICWEYAYFNIPVLTATLNSPFNMYKFNIHSKSKKNYLENLKNLSEIKKNYSRDINEIYEYYFTHYLFHNNNNLLPFYDDFMDKYENWDLYYSHNFYNFFMEQCKLYSVEDIKQSFDKYINSYDIYSNLNHSKQGILNYLKNLSG